MAVKKGVDAKVGKVVSVRFTDASLHIKGRQYALGKGKTFGEIVSIALAEYLKRNA